MIIKIINILKTIILFLKKNFVFLIWNIFNHDLKNRNIWTKLKLSELNNLNNLNNEYLNWKNNFFDIYLFIVFQINQKYTFENVVGYRKYPLKISSKSA